MLPSSADSNMSITNDNSFQHNLHQSFPYTLSSLEVVKTRVKRTSMISIPSLAQRLGNLKERLRGAMIRTRNNDRNPVVSTEPNLGE